MTPADIAGIIAASAFVILVALLAVPLLKLGRVFDEASKAIRELSDNVTPLIEEATTTLTESNKQLVRVDAITSDVADVTGNISALVAVVSASIGRPLVRIAALAAGVRATIGRARRGKHEPKN